MHSYETLAILALALSTALPAFSAPVQTSADIQSLEQRAPSLGRLASGLLNKLDTSESFGKIFGNSLVSGVASGTASSGVKNLLNETRRDSDENNAVPPSTRAELPHPNVGVLPVVSRPANPTFPAPSTLSNPLIQIYKPFFDNGILPGRSFRREPSPLSLNDITAFVPKLLNLLNLRSEPGDSLLNRDDALSGSPEERRRSLISTIQLLKDFKNTIH